MKRLHVSALSLLVVLLFAASLFAGCSSSPKTLEVTYYAKPGCSHCQDNSHSLATLEKEFPGQVRTRVADATAADSVRAMRVLGIPEHGIVIRSPNGAVLWKYEDHNVNLDEVRKEVKDLIAYQQQASL
jgi:hypothetical protein